MAEDFIANYYREGMTVKDVRALLGPPDFVGSHQDLNYDVGSVVIDPVILTIVVSDDGVTKGAHIYVQP